MPHDAMLEKRAYAESLNGRNTGFHDGEVYQYVKLLNPDVQERNRTMIMKFEGIYMNAMVYVNGQRKYHICTVYVVSCMKTMSCWMKIWKHSVFERFR